MKVTSEPLAHLTKDGRPHPLIEHLSAVGELAHKFGAALGAAEWARLAGRWHDLGKYAADFQNRIRTENGFEEHLEGVVPGARDHSSAGAVHAIRKDEQTGKSGRGWPLAFAIAGHHAGLPDVADLRQRISAKTGRLEAALQGGAPRELLDTVLPPLPPALESTNNHGKRRDLELWIRLLFSALCDADFLDTEDFYDSNRAALRGSDVSIPELDARLRAHLDGIERAAPDTEVNRVRAEVRRACLGAAELPPGAFSLTVPTGGGKTLASLTFALAHAVRHGLRRVVVAIPFTSIIEQTAEVYRLAVGDGAVLEHHSALEPLRETPKSRVAAENWDHPLIVTTTVQLFESLLANRPGACRKLHRLAGSVMILDEAQAVRLGSTRPVLDVLRSLIELHGASVVISTATQPAWRRSAILPEGLPDVREIVHKPERAFARLRRVKVIWPDPAAGPVTWAVLGGELAAHDDALAIVHRRRDARDLCVEVDRAAGTQDTLHLSALMCPQHRSEVLRAIRSRKAAAVPVRLIATQLVEAGVDLDFRVVYRALAGMDALAQAAGRCNREGRLAHGVLHVFHAPTAPPGGVLQAGLAVTRTLLAEQGPVDLFAPDTHRRYFELLFQAQDLDDRQIQEARAALRFKTVAGQFKLIDDEWSVPLVVPWGRSPELLAEMERFGPSRERLRALQRFLVNVPRKLRDEWLAAGTAREVAGLVALSETHLYDARFGLVPEPSPNASTDRFIVDG